MGMASTTSDTWTLPAPSRLKPAAIEQAVAVAVVAAVAGAVAWGWINREQLPVDPHRGLGYALGIIGGSMMLILLGYPIRKRLRGPRPSIGSVGAWFRLHMLLGLIGPLAVLYHARFSWGALNSAFALGAMVIVASSGLIGRFFYSRVHRGYSGRKLELRSLKQEMEARLATMADFVASAEVRQRLRPFEDRAIAAGGAFWSSAGAVIGLGVETRRASQSLLRDLPSLRGAEGARARAAIDAYFEAVRRAAEFAFYDRLLRLWHLLHLPLFVLLVAAAILHIVAVHMY